MAYAFPKHSVRLAQGIALSAAALLGSAGALAQSSTIAACTTYNSVVTTPSNLSAWNFSETRTTGHNALTPNSMHIWTEGNTITDKAAGYYATNFPLTGLGAETIAETGNWTTVAGTIPPSTQLVIDFNNDGTPDGILVGETAYGNNWWLSNSAQAFVKTGAPHTGGGYGSDWYGTANEWLTAFPNARVRAIGYSLGSGVLGDYQINRITLGCTHYTFSSVDAPVAVPTLWPGALAVMGLALAGLARRRLTR